MKAKPESFHIVTRTGRGQLSPAEVLLDTGSIMVNGAFSPEMSEDFVHKLMYLNALDDKRTITIYVNSRGGAVHDGLGMIDLCRRVSNPIVTVGWGLCASMGALFLACAAPRGSRYVTPNCEVMMHQPLGGAEGQVTDIVIAARHAIGLKRSITAMTAAACGKTEKEIARVIERNRWFNADEAVAYGLADEVLVDKKVAPTETELGIIMPEGTAKGGLA